MLKIYEILSYIYILEERYIFVKFRTEKFKNFICTGWGGESWTKTFFSLYRPSYLIEAYVWPEKYWLVWAGPLANHPFNFNFIFLSDG
jgi:hypothetical protein